MLLLSTTFTFDQTNFWDGMLAATIIVTLCSVICDAGILYPYESPTREVKRLDGIWNFLISPPNDPTVGFREEWYTKQLSQSGPVVDMPVPASYNDITQRADIRDFIGWAWYDRQFYVSDFWFLDKKNIFLRFGSCHYNCIVWVNGLHVMEHSGGHLPFVAEIKEFVRPGVKNLITVAVNNTLTRTTIPTGDIVYKNSDLYPKGFFEQTLDFDFFNYAGIHRPVFLYSTPATFVKDIDIFTSIEGKTGTISYQVRVFGPATSRIDVTVFDKKGVQVGENSGAKGSISITDCHFWWPYLMDTEPGYLYELQVTVSDGKNVDIYSLNVGIRTITWSNTTVMINNKPLYLHGFGRHEDYEIRGKGVDDVMIVKDHNLLLWIGANSYRTSHYPYAEEILDLTDKLGIIIIDECPAVGLKEFTPILLAQHQRSLQELMARDKNRASVLFWSVANEPKSNSPQAEEYFRSVLHFVRNIDKTRPFIAALSYPFEEEKVAQFLDVLAVNRYFSWYWDTGHLELVTNQIVTEFTNWHKKFNKPVMISEYGAGSIAGFHSDPPNVWTEDFQIEMTNRHFEAFDILRSKGFFFGEHIWNFADFMTPQETFRPGGCMKGVFTRNRQPKSVAYIVKKRYWNSSLIHKDLITNEISQRF